ncbi:Cytosine permease [Koleobacter methoxysyntrophicus]|uniref:Cytosine permease n=1 Tax=Koleobacter methoxysyntrophicus TaxID=2751313 RepID=A0A8A0RI52_9FIRM|nr:cytosine permease [Koleobacter methoxysyntrophicus]QSQ08141.1 Cytosine permease [Koleobacter methoxysyntrophicus]
MSQNSDRDFPLDHVPESARVGLVSLAAVLLGFTFFSPTMVAGGRVAAAYSLNDFLKVMLAGNLILGLYVGVMAVIGTKTGLTSVLLSRYALGSMGAKWAGFLLGGTQLGWYAVSAAYVAELYAAAFNMPNSYIFWAVFWSLVMGFTAVYGFKGMETISYIAIPLILVLTVWVPILGIQKAGSWSALAAIRPESSMPMTTALTIIVGTFASGGTQVTNWSRFAKSAGISFFAAMLAFFFGNGLMIFSGGIGAIAFQQPDLVEVFLQMGIIFFAMAILTVNIWTTNDAAAYAFGVAGAEFFNRPDKKPFVIGGVLIATVLAATGIYSWFIPWLVMLGIFIPPLGGTIIGDFLFTWKGKMPRMEEVEFKPLRYSNIVAYLLGTVAAWLGQTFDFGIPPLQGIIVAALMVPVVNAVFKAVGSNDAHQLKNKITF